VSHSPSHSPFPALSLSLRSTRLCKLTLSAPSVPRRRRSISLLTPFEPCLDPLDWIIGTHGIYITFHNPSQPNVSPVLSIPARTRRNGDASFVVPLPPFSLHQLQLLPIPTFYFLSYSLFLSRLFPLSSLLSSPFLLLKPS